MGLSEIKLGEMLPNRLDTFATSYYCTGAYKSNRLFLVSRLGVAIFITQT